MARKGIQVLNTGGVVKSLRTQGLSGRSYLDVQVGYSAGYARYVHERTDIPHQNGQAKFLESPARKYRQQMREMARATMRRKRSVEEAAKKVAKFLYEKSQELVPVRTGNLKRSGYWKWK